MMTTINLKTLLGNTAIALLCVFPAQASEGEDAREASVSFSAKYNAAPVADAENICRRDIPRRLRSLKKQYEELLWNEGRARRKYSFPKKGAESQEWQKRLLVHEETTAVFIKYAQSLAVQSVEVSPCKGRSAAATAQILFHNMQNNELEAAFNAAAEKTREALGKCIDAKSSAMIYNADLEYGAARFRWQQGVGVIAIRSHMLIKEQKDALTTRNDTYTRFLNIINQSRLMACFSKKSRRLKKTLPL